MIMIVDMIEYDYMIVDMIVDMIEYDYMIMII